MVLRTSAWKTIGIEDNKNTSFIMRTKASEVVKRVYELLLSYYKAHLVSLRIQFEQKIGYRTIDGVSLINKRIVCRPSHD